MKGFSPFTQYDPVKKPVGPVTGDVKAEYGKRQVWNLVEREKVGDFGTLLYAGHDWQDVPLARNSMKLMAEKVMPQINKNINIAAQ